MFYFSVTWFTERVFVERLGDQGPKVAGSGSYLQLAPSGAPPIPKPQFPKLELPILESQPKDPKLKFQAKKTQNSLAKVLS